MRVRTDGGAAVAGAILAAVLTVVTVGDGAAPQRVDPAAVAAARAERGHFQLPKRQGERQVVPAAAGTPQVVETTGAATPTPEPPVRPAPSLDAFFLQALQGSLTYLLLFGAAHLGLRRLRVGARGAYAGVGAACALACVASQTPLAGWHNLIVLGRLSIYLGIPLVAGSIMGFLYHWRAGLDAEGDDPALLARVVAGGAEAGGVSDDGALADTGQAEYFAGPLQVRTSLPIAFVASLLSSGLFGLAQMLFGVSGEIGRRLNDGANLSLDEVVGMALQSQLGTIFIMGLMAPIPFTGLVMLGHMILRARDKTGYGAYLLMGAAAPVLLTLVLGPMGFIVGLQAAIPMAISMSVYRNMAGVEPKPVKEDIRVKDRRDLVGADHARRRFGRLIKT